MDQFILDLDDWLASRGANVYASRKMVEACRIRDYWADWLARQRDADGMPKHVELPAPEAA